MKYLRKYIRRLLLAESAKGLNDLPEGYLIVVEARRGMDITAEGARIFYAIQDEDYPEEYHYCRFGRCGEMAGKINISPYSTMGYGECGNAWKVDHSEASDGYGPLLYDIAMEIATMHGGGLTPDRVSVSDDAREVWDYYLNNREDVIAHQLDNLQDHLTPGVKDDNCNQEQARVVPGVYDIPDSDSNDRRWVQSAISKRYTKRPVTVNRLEKLGKIRWA